MRMLLKDNSKKVKMNLLTKKNLLILVISLLIVSIIIGIIFFILLKDSDKLLIQNNIDSLFKNESDNLNYFKNLFNSLINNFCYVIFSFLLGISIIGIIAVLFMLFFKGITIGVSISSIFSKYQISGIIGNILYLFPDKILSLFLFIFMSYFSILFGINIFIYLFLKKDINLQLQFKNYIKKFYIGLIIATIISILEVFVSPIILNLFTFFMK
ncbi:MAG TPA: stage II sporulation protein M [Bacilli bacterium]|nr:stage II sporulation protein M [Bacilli bacterium]